jgi:hypothetical protein
MAKANGRPRGRPPHKNSKAALPMPGDEQYGDYSRERLLRMDSKFVARVERAFRNGGETQEAAGAGYDPKGGRSSTAFRADKAGIWPVTAVRPASHMTVRATSYATRCTGPSPRSLSRRLERHALKET